MLWILLMSTEQWEMYEYEYIYIHNLVLLIFSCESDKGVVVYNTPPEANIISHENASEVFEDILLNLEQHYQM